jgi:serine/threonine-protein kinase
MSPGMDEDVAKLVREERIAAAATLASSRGDAQTASELFERACEWRRAAEEATRASDHGRALTLAVVARDPVLAASALEHVVTDHVNASRVAGVLERRGDHGWAARVLERIGKKAEAARAYEKDGAATEAARLLEEGNDAIGAARVLEAAVRRAPTQWKNHVALGRLLLRYGKVEGAVRTLQPIPGGAPERREALVTLIAAMKSLGLEQAILEATRELDKLGGPPPSLPEPAARPLAEVKSRLFGRYEIAREVANTATARVVECIDTVRGEHVAVKIFAGYNARGGGRDVLARFEREVKVLGSIDHPNVVPLRDYYPEGPALVLAWMGGGTLETMIASRAIAPSRAIEIACAVLTALGEAHRLGVLHRDIKPANVLFDGAGAARLGDFGVAHLGDLSATATAGLIGTLGYMSPEQREGKPATVQSDIYGVGAVLFEMLTGERIGFDAVAKILPSGVHRDLGPRHDAVVLSLLAQDAHARPPDAFAARRALTALSWPSTLEPAAPAPKSQRSPSHHPDAARIHPTEDGREIDTWIGRPIERIPLTDAVLARAGTFARAGHPSLQTVLRVDREAREIWLDAPRGTPLDRELRPGEEELLRRALDALHGAGGVHGKVDRAHVLVGPGDALVLRFEPQVEPTATVDLDRIQLSRL